MVASSYVVRTALCIHLLFITVCDTPLTQDTECLKRDRVTSENSSIAVHNINAFVYIFKKRKEEKCLYVLSPCSDA